MRYCIERNRQFPLSDPRIIEILRKGGGGVCPKWNGDRFFREAVWFNKPLSGKSATKKALKWA
jgi:hypothetical protein